MPLHAEDISSNRFSPHSPSIGGPGFLSQGRGPRSGGPGYLSQGHGPRIGGPGYLSMNHDNRWFCQPHFRPFYHRPRVCVGFGFYESPIFCPTYYEPYFVGAPAYVVAPPYVQETVVVSPPATYTYAQPPVTYDQPPVGYGGGGYGTSEAMAGTGDTGAAEVPAAGPAQTYSSPPATTGRQDSAAGDANGQQLYLMMYEGTKQFSDGAYEAAARLFLDVTLKDPGNVDAALAYGVGRFATGDYAVAAVAIRRGVSRLPDIVNSSFDIRDRYGNATDLARHMQALQNYVRQHPDNADALLILGFVQHFTDQRDAARQTFERLRQVSRPDAGLAGTFLNAKPLPPAPAAAPGDTQQSPAPPSAPSSPQSMYDESSPLPSEPLQRVSTATPADEIESVPTIDSDSPYVEILE